MESPAVRQLPCIQPERAYAWAVQLDPLWGAPAAHTTLEQMFFLGEQVSHIVTYEEYRRDLLRRHDELIAQRVEERHVFALPR